MPFLCALSRYIFHDFKPLIRNSIIIVVVVHNIKDIIAVFIFLTVWNPVIVIIIIGMIWNSGTLWPGQYFSIFKCRTVGRHAGDHHGSPFPN